ncbi:MAG: hypothetical protein COB41_00400 [Proteobacteria bacterium]|nr:MAG: hypothetical protein COB41_00400 [Pseudomonadota bacterium]
MPNKPVSKLDGNQTLQYGFDDDKQAHRTLDLGQLVPEEYDYIALTYVVAGDGAGEIETVSYKTSGASGTTVASLLLTYDSSNRIETITRS